MTATPMPALSTLRRRSATTTRARVVRVVAPYDRAAVVEAVCAEVAAGAKVRTIFAVPGMPDRGTFFRWLYADPALMAQYREARTFGGEVDFEEFEALAESATACQTMTEVQALRLRLDMLRWSLAKRAPKLFGDRIDHTTDGHALASFTLQIGTA